MGKKLLTPSNLKAVRFELSGLDEYLKRVQAAGNNVDDAVKKAVKAGSKPVYEDIKAWAEKHKFTGTTLKGVSVSDAQQSGNFIFVEVGIDSNVEYNAWHAVFVEYGTPAQPADPGIRTAFAQNKSKVKKIEKNILMKEGIPIG
jgi:HK97 gp10 family phage protein